jgi:hypothetical protein
MRSNRLEGHGIQTSARMLPGDGRPTLGSDLSMST